MVHIRKMFLKNQLLKLMMKMIKKQMEYKQKQYQVYLIKSVINQPEEEIFDNNVDKLDGKFRKVENDAPGKDLCDEDGSKYNGKYVKVDSEPEEVFVIYRNKLG